jgi:hypothetical protein
VWVQYIACPNPECKKTTLTILYGPAIVEGGNLKSWREREAKTRRLLPPTYARPIPEYVPLAIRQDYEEACAIVDLSPKSAAALARRVLQGIVRNFHHIIRSTLYEELEALKPSIDPLVWGAIDVVRSVGNIGAHMEKDINIIVDVDPEEAVKLIRLIELLIAEWYVAKNNREVALADIIALGEDKQKNRKGTGSTDSAAGTEATTEL